MGYQTQGAAQDDRTSVGQVRLAGHWTFLAGISTAQANHKKKHEWVKQGRIRWEAARLPPSFSPSQGFEGWSGGSKAIKVKAIKVIVSSIFE